MNRTTIKQTAQAISYKANEFIMNHAALFLVAAALMLVCGFVHAGDEGGGTDLLSSALSGSVEKTVGATGKFWKIFILFDIVLAAAAAVKTKNPLVFGGVFITAFLPGILLSTLVF